MRDSLEHLRPLFISESERILGEMNEAFSALQRDPADADARLFLCRGAHTLKGSAAVMSFDEVAGFVVLIERAMGCFEDQPHAFDSAVEAQVREILDLMTQLVEEVAHGGEQIADRARMAELEKSGPPGA